MTISVLMSVYKSEKGAFLDRSLQSVWDDQTRKPEQIVLIEDGAIPEELELIIDSFQSRVNASGVAKMVVVKLPVNGGLTKALNAGIKHVTGDLIARMDSDDISASQRFDLQEKFFRENPEVDILGGSMQEFDDEHECLNVRHYPLTHEDACKYIVKACPLAHPAVMMRRRIFDEGLHYDERYRMSQDIKLWYDAILAGYRMANLQEIVLFFRQQGDVFRRRSRVKAWNEFKIYMNGIYRMHGLFTLAYRYPIARYVFRNLPPSLVKRIYESGMRKKVLEGTRK
ncbi:MAG: glycosyltransferase [Prevotella sp.]|nr:glycosyltransferase [Prevotella sp.]